MDIYVARFHVLNALTVKQEKCRKKYDTQIYTVVQLSYVRIIMCTMYIVTWRRFSLSLHVCSVSCIFLTSDIYYINISIYIRVVHRYMLKNKVQVIN